jgi:outer membrane protein insertion porin family
VITTVTPIERNRVNLTFTWSKASPAASRKSASWATRRSDESTLKGLFDLTPAAG